MNPGSLQPHVAPAQPSSVRPVDERADGDSASTEDRPDRPAALQLGPEPSLLPQGSPVVPPGLRYEMVRGPEPDALVAGPTERGARGTSPNTAAEQPQPATDILAGYHTRLAQKLADHEDLRRRRTDAEKPGAGGDTLGPCADADPADLRNRQRTPDDGGAKPRRDGGDASAQRVLMFEADEARGPTCTHDPEADAATGDDDESDEAHGHGHEALLRDWYHNMVVQARQQATTIEDLEYVVHTGGLGTWQRTPRCA